MKLFTWSAKAGPAVRGARFLTVAGTDQDGVPVALTDVVEIKNDMRSGITLAVREAGEEVPLS